jgi:hypothetical protein
MGSATKTLKTSDISAYPFRVYKQYTIPSSSYASSSITILSGSYNIDTNTPVSQSLINYNSLKQLYYAGYLTSSVQTNNKSGSYYDNYIQSTAASGTVEYEYRYFPTDTGSNIYTISIPQILYGEQIKPQSFILSRGVAGVTGSLYIVDDGNGNLLDINNLYLLYVNKGYVLEGYITGSEQTPYIGNIFYAHGIASITNQTYITSSTIFSSSISYKSTNTIYENQIRCHVSENEFNLTQNPTSVSGSKGDYYYYITGSDFNPYVTTVGLYNPSDELLAVGKLAQPFRMPSNTDVTFILKYDS